jgi:hypothetical protein
VVQINADTTLKMESDSGTTGRATLFVSVQSILAAFRSASALPFTASLTAAERPVRIGEPRLHKLDETDVPKACHHEDVDAGKLAGHGRRIR